MNQSISCVNWNEGTTSLNIKLHFHKMKKIIIILLEFFEN